MDRTEFKEFRKQLNKTQKQMAQLLGVSIKAVHSYEQGWRSVPAAVERQLLFLASRLQSQRKNNLPHPDPKVISPRIQVVDGQLTVFDGE